MKKFYTLFSIVLLSGYVTLGFFNVAQAACSYKINRFDPQGRTAALTTESLTFEVEVEVSNEQCPKSENSNAVLMLLDAKTSTGSQVLKTSSLQYSGRLAKMQITYNLSNLNLSLLNRENIAVFGLWINAGVSVSGTNVAKSNPWTVSLTGGSGSSGSIPASITFFALSGGQKVQKSIFSANEQIEIVFNISAQTVQNSIPQTSPNLELRYNINNKYSDTLGVSRSNLSNKPSSQFLVSPQFGFQNNNTVVVALHDKDDGRKFTEARATVQATGLGNASTVSVSFDKQQVALGGTFLVTISNAPTGFVGTYAVNDKEPLAIRGESFSLTASEANGFKQSASNTIIFNIIDQAGKVTTITKNITTGGGGTPGQPATPPGPPNTSLTETLFNPLPSDSLTGTLLTIAKGFLAIVGIWAVVFIMIGGFKMVMSQGNEEAYLAAKKTITWAVLGIVVAMMSFSIIAIVQNLIGARTPDYPGDQPVTKP